jgi:hypothetical protein
LVAFMNPCTTVWPTPCSFSTISFSGESLITTTGRGGRSPRARSLSAPVVVSSVPPA